MKTAAVIAEYNPFHNGHQYQLEKIRQMHQADYIIVIMSGDFVQRGAPAILDKYTRAKMAIACGADLVLELPVIYALGSAEYFALGAVYLLNALHTVDILHFGSESGDIAILQELAALYTHSPASYTLLLQNYLKAGLSYPSARAKASIDHFKQKDASYDSSAIEAVLAAPNNALGIEYCKAILRLQSSISPSTIQRVGAGYHETQIYNCSDYPSASAIRNILSHEPDLKKLSTLIPDAALSVCQEKSTVLLTENDFSSILHYKLLMQENRDYTEYLDVTSELSNRIAKHLQEFTTIDSFCNILKAKNYTYTRICRCLFHILLDIRQHYPLSASASMPHYVRVLGFRKSATPLLTKIKENSDITLLSKLADYKKILSEEDWEILQKDLYAYRIYQSVITQKTGIAADSEFTKPIILL